MTKLNNAGSIEQYWMNEMGKHRPKVTSLNIVQ